MTQAVGGAGVATSLEPLRCLFDLQGRTALAIGAGGIGSCVSRALDAFGAHVVCADVDASVAAAVTEDIRCAGGRAEARRLDVTEPASIAAALHEIGTPDVLVVMPAMNVRKRLLDLTDSEFERVVSLNLTGSFRVMRDVGRAMAARGSGSIVAFSSIRAVVVEPGQGVYAATKAGVVQLVKTLAAELGPRGVRVNAVAPGVVTTPLTEQIRADAAWRDAYAEKTALRRWASPDEIVGAVVFLASDASSYVTGTQLMVDGGWTAADGRFDPPT